MPDRLCDLLAKGELDVALVARPDGFVAPFQPQPLYRERFVIACSAGHPFARKNVVRVADLDGQPYLARINCEYYDALRDICHANGSHLVGSFRSEREDWILTMVAAGMGICFLPEYSNTIPGRDQPSGDLAVGRARGVPGDGRRASLVVTVSAFVRAVKQYRWPEAPDAAESESPVREPAAAQ